MDPEQYHGLAGFRLALRRFIAASEAINREAGITQQQYQALLVIKTRAEDTLSIRGFAEQLLLTHHAAVQLVDRLVAADLARREPSMQDRRAVNLVLSSKGDILLDELAGKHLHEMLLQEPLLSRSLRALKKVGTTDLTAKSRRA